MKQLTINGRRIGPGQPVYVIAEMSANHNQDYDAAVRIIHAMKDSGADAVKLQTYTPDTMTISSDREYFQIGKGTVWEGRNLYDLYGEAYTPWKWQPQLMEIANQLGLDLFSTPFDKTAVDFLEDMGVPCYKIASFELVDLPLIEYVASKGKPIIMSIGMGTLVEVAEAVEVVEKSSCPLALLKCTSAYPSLPEDMNLRTISNMSEVFDVVVGLSDHTLDVAVPVAAVALGASIIEKHFTLSRDQVGPDSAFSLEPAQFRAMVDAVRTAERAVGQVKYGLTDREKATRVFRRSIFAIRDIAAGETFTQENVRVIRPGHGLEPKYLPQVLARRASRTISRGTPLNWDLLY